MSLLRAVDVPPPTVRSAEGRVRVTALLAAALWFDVLYAAAAHTNASPLPPWLAALTGLATLLVFTGCEAAVAVQAWGIAGVSARWAALAPRIMAVSAAEAFAVSVAVGHAPLPPALAVLLAGVRAAGGAQPASGWSFAFAAFGLLTLVRLVLSAHAQAGAVRASFVRALVLVLTLYLATRLAMWWTFDLMQGRSFQPWGNVAWPGSALNG